MIQQIQSLYKFTISAISKIENVYVDQAAADTVFDMINVTYYDKPLMFIGLYI